MTRRDGRAPLLSCLVLLGAAACGRPRAEPPPVREVESGLLAGVAGADLTPSRPVPLAGYGKRRGRAFVAVHDRPQARALVVRSGAASVAVVAADLLVVPSTLREAVRAAVSDLPLDGLLLAASHNHAGPGGFWDNELAEVVAMGRFDPAWSSELAARLAAGVREAWSRAAPARVRSASGAAAGLARNRRFEDGPLDETLDLLVLETEAPGPPAPLAWIVGFGAHPTLLDAQNLLLSGEYPAVTRRLLEAETGAGVLFVNGAGGDQEPVVPEGESGFAAVRSVGGALARRALSLSEALGAPAAAGIGVAHERVDLPGVDTRALAGPILRGLTDPLVSLFTPSSTVVQAIRIGDARLLALPCDLGAGVGLDLRSRFAGAPLLLASYANDYVGYVVDPRSFERGGYEARMSFFGGGLGEPLVAAAGAVLRAIENP